MRFSFKKITLTTILFWMGLFALVPFVLAFATSFLSSDLNSLVVFKVTIKNYLAIFQAGYLRIMLHSLVLALGCSFICLLIGYPFAFIIARTKSRYRSLLLLLVIIPFWTSSLIRTYAIMALIKAKGIINTTLLALGLIHHPLQILYTSQAVLIGLVYDLLPFMILPLYANMEKLDDSLLEAARDLGSKKLRTLFKIIIPLTMPGILAGFLLVFLPAMTMFYIPVLLGGAKDLLLGNLIEYQFLTANNWPFGAAISMLVTIIMCVFIFVYWRSSRNERSDNRLEI